MFNPLTLLPFLLLLTPSSGIPIEKRAGQTCGSVVYTAAQVNAASTKAYSLYKAGTTLGSNSYPHTFNNNEGFSFAVAGPYQEFPILPSGVYTGGTSSTSNFLLAWVREVLLDNIGSPGADRVVINTSGKQAGGITHTGASGNNFVKCK